MLLRGFYLQHLKIGGCGIFVPPRQLRIPIVTRTVDYGSAHMMTLGQRLIFKIDSENISGSRIFYDLGIGRKYDET